MWYYAIAGLKYMVPEIPSLLEITADFPVSGFLSVSGKTKWK
jgi:hypothetical protein